MNRATGQGKIATIIRMSDPTPALEGKPTDDDIQVFLALYAAERMDSAYLMQAGRAILGTLLVYVGAAVAFSKDYLNNALFILAVPMPALGLLIVFAVNGFNLSLRDVSGRTLETLLVRATSEYLPHWTIASLHRGEVSIPEDECKVLDALQKKHFRGGEGTPLREIAIGMGATEHFYNRKHANPHQSWFLRIYTALTAFFVLTGMTLVFCHGLFEAFREPPTPPWHSPQWAVLWLEVAVFIVLVAVFFWTLVSGWKHRRRAEMASKILLNALPAGSHSDPQPNRPS